MRIINLPRQMPLKQGNLVTVEIEENGKHRMFRSFSVPVDYHGNFKNLNEVLDWITRWEKNHPGHTCRLHFNSSILAQRYREGLTGQRELPKTTEVKKEDIWERQRKNLETLRKAGKEITGEEDEI